MNYLITGTTGHLGHQILQQLLKLVPKENVTAGVHTIAKAKAIKDAGIKVSPIDFNDPKTLNQAFSNQDVLIYVPSKSHDSFSRVSELEHVIMAAKTAKIKHFLAMGFIADQVNNPFALSAFYGYLPRRLASSGLNYTIIRNALYADPLVPYLPELIERKNVIYPMQDQALSFISLTESAAAFAKVAATETLMVTGKVYTLTQARNYTMPQLAEVLSKVSGTKIGYQPVSSSEFAQMYNQGNEGHMLASMYDAGAIGLLNETSRDFETIMGHGPLTLEEYLKQNYQA